MNRIVNNRPACGPVGKLAYGRVFGRLAFLAGVMTLGGCASDGFPKVGTVVAPPSTLATRAMRASVTDLQKEAVRQQKLAREIIKGRVIK